MTLKQLLGLDTRADRYTYGVDPAAGYISNQKVPDRWVSTTCGYCSVGCGMFVGVKDGRAVSVRGNPDHPVNRGMLCPKGLSEHHTINTDNRALYPMLRTVDGFSRVGWNTALGMMGARFREVQAKYGPESVGVISTGQLVTEEFYTLGKLVQLGLGTRNYCGNTTLCMSTAVAGYKRSFGSDGPPGAYEDMEKADVVMLIGANIAENHPILCWRLQSNPNRTLIVVDPARHQDRDDGRSAPADPATVGPGADQRHDPHHHRARPDRPRVHRPSHDGIRDAARVGAGVHAGACRRDHRHQSRDALAGGLGLRARARRVHRLDDGREPQHQGHGNGERHQQPGAHHRQHRPQRRVAVLDYRPVQRDGHARGWLHLEPAWLSQVRECRGPAGAGRPLEYFCRSHSDGARSRVSRHHRGGARSAHPRALDHRHQPGRVVPELRLRSRRPSRGSTSSSCRTGITRRRPRSSRT